MPSRRLPIRKRYRPLGLSPEMRSPSRAASNTLKWHPHSNNGFAGFSGTIRANRASSVTSSTWHCSCGQVMHSALNSALARRKRTPLMRTRRPPSPCALRRGERASATNGTGCHGAATVSTGMLTGRTRAAYRIGAVGAASWAHTRRPKPRNASTTVANPRRFTLPYSPRDSRDLRDPRDLRNPRDLTLTFASARKAPRPSACVSASILWGIGCAPSLSSPEHRTL